MQKLWMVACAAALAASACGRCDEQIYPDARIMSTELSPVRIRVRVEASACAATALSCHTSLHQADNTILAMVSADACSEAACAPAEIECFPGALPAGTYGVSVNGAPPRYSFAVE